MYRNCWNLKRASMRVKSYLHLNLWIALVAVVLPSVAQEIYQNKEVAPSQVIVKFKAGVQQVSVSSISALTNAVSVTPIGGAGAAVLKSQNKTVDQLITILKAQPDVELVEPDYLIRVADNDVSIAQTPGDPYFYLLWGMKNTARAGVDINVAPVWDRFRGSNQVVVGIVDTGIDYRHPDLQANVWSAPTAFSVTVGGRTITCAAGTHGYNANTRTCDPNDDHYHGTHTAGTIGAAGNNGTGVAGVNWTTSIIGLKFLDKSGLGSTSSAIDAIEFAIQVKAKFGSAANIRVLNNSWGGPNYSGALLDEINRAAASDMLFVAAAGNETTNNDVTPSYPASYNAANVISVAAIDSNDALAYFSNYGSRTVHVGAPGANIYSTKPNSGYQYLSGTSMAAPHVSGAAALILSACALNTTGLKNNLISTVTRTSALTGKTTTGGRINVGNAVSACAGGGPQAFSLSAPTNGATGVSGTPTLSWTASTNATSYDVYLGTATAPALYRSGVMTLSLAVSTALTANTKYYWQVVARNAQGTATTAVWSFTTLANPGAFSLSSPSNGATNVQLSPTLSWSASSGASSYDIYLSTSSSPALYKSGNTTTSLAVSPALSQNTQYYWKVVAKNAAGSVTSPTWGFKTGANPGSFTLTSPSNGASGVSLSPTLTWGASASATSYDLYLSTASSPALSKSGLTATTYSVTPALAANTLYYWKVVAKNTLGTATSPTWSFRTLTAPGAFNLVAPTSGQTTTVTPALSWSASSGAQAYDVYLGTSSSPALYRSGVTGTSLTVSPALTVNTTYYWTVKARNGAGTTSSAVWSFRTGAPPSAFSLTSPSSGITNVSSSPTLAWSASANATSYDLYLGTTNPPALYRSNLTSISSTASGLGANTQYYWKVVSKNSLGTATTVVWGFRTR